jgi:hypothetical protein
MIDLRQGRYQDTLADVTCDALIVDAPYSDDAEWLYKRDREDKGTEGLPMFTCTDSPTVAE